MRVRTVLLILAISLGLAAGCRADSPPSTEPGGEGRLVVAIQEPASVDPALLNGNQDFQVAVNLHEGLFAWNPAKGEVVPALASDHRCSEDGLSWTFVIRDDAHFSDGRPVTAGDFVRSWLRILDPATASPGADALYFIKGARGQVEGGTPAAVTAPDDRTLHLELEMPQPYLPQLLASPRLAPVMVEEGRVIGAGPYRVAEWLPRRSARLESNPHYPEGRRPAVTQVELFFTQSEESALAWWDAGKVDLVVGLAPMARLPVLRERYPEEIVTFPMRSVFYLMLNVNRGPTDELALRMALAAGLDREQLVTQVLGAGQLPARTFLPPGPHFSPQPCTWPLPAAARAALGEAGIARAAGTEMICNSSETLKSIMEFLQHSLKRNLGLHLGLRMVEWNSFLELLKGADFAIARMSLTGGVDPIDFLANFGSDSSNNFGRYRNPEYDRLLALVRQQPREDVRRQLMEQAHQLLCRDLPAVPVYLSSQLFLVRRPNSGRLAPTPDGWVLYGGLLPVPDRR